jgi:aryl carrier-like protein
VGIWQELLDIEQVGIHDNFFELGGDSILAIQLVSRARNAGIEVKVADVFAYQTIAQLSALVEHGAAVLNNANAEQDKLTGTCGLLPVQQWYFETEQTNVSHFNQTVLLAIDKSITGAILDQAIQHLTNQHDALRFKYYQQDGKWQQEYGSAGIAINREDLSLATGDSLTLKIGELTDRYQRSLSIEKGEIIRVVWIETPDAEKANRLFIVIHHLAVDGVSWRILLEELDRLLTGSKNNIGAHLGQKSASYRQWYETLAAYGQSTALLQQLPYWQQAVKNYQPLSIDKEYHGNVKVKDTASFTVKLGAGQTASLLKDAPRVYHTEINDLLLCALAQTLGTWANTNTITIGLEGHGREHITDDIDISRTVGWFTTLFPLLLNTGGLSDQAK